MKKACLKTHTLYKKIPNPIFNELTALCYIAFRSNLQLSTYA